jgi:hypothetical protein
MQTLFIVEYGKDYRSACVFCVLRYVTQTPFGEKQLTHLVRFEQSEWGLNDWTAAQLRDAVAAKIQWSAELIEFSTEPVHNVRVGMA